MKERECIHFLVTIILVLISFGFLWNILKRTKKIFKEGQEVSLSWKKGVSLEISLETQRFAPLQGKWTVLKMKAFLSPYNPRWLVSAP